MPPELLGKGNRYYVPGKVRVAGRRNRRSRAGGHKPGCQWGAPEKVRKIVVKVKA